MSLQNTDINNTFTTFDGTDSYEISQALREFPRKEERSSKSVLIVEDDLSQMIILEELILEINPNVDIDWEMEANRAIDRVSKKQEENAREGSYRSYDIVISDIALNEKSSGVEIFEYCEKHFPATQVLLISAHTKRELQKNHLLNNRPVVYLQKPLNFNRFFQKVAPILEVAS